MPTVSAAQYCIWIKFYFQVLSNALQTKIICELAPAVKWKDLI